MLHQRDDAIGREPRRADRLAAAGHLDDLDDAASGADLDASPARVALISYVCTPLPMSTTISTRSPRMPAMIGVRRDTLRPIPSRRLRHPFGGHGNEDAGTLMHVGTSGWQYDDWRGRFYPDDVPQRVWLPFYAGRFSTVEVNNSFTGSPNAPRSSAGASRPRPGSSSP